MIYKPKGGGPRQRKIRSMLATHRQPLETWWIAEQLGARYEPVRRSLQRLYRRGVVRRLGTPRKYAYALAVAA